MTAPSGSTSVGATERLSVQADATEPERTLGQLVADASRDLSSIIRSEVALAKAEVTADVKAAGTGAAMFAVAGVLAFLALVLLLIAAAYGLVAAGLSPWLAFLIVAVVLLVIGAVAALLGKSRISKVGPPERTVRTTKETVDTLKQAKPHTR
ncbi:phage holin family protein [Angustibacter aerolatus]